MGTASELEAVNRELVTARSDLAAARLASAKLVTDRQAEIEQEKIDSQKVAADRNAVAAQFDKQKTGAIKELRKKPMFPQARESTLSKASRERQTYLMDLYRMYHGHINMMFNYFLLAAGLVANAFISSSAKSADMRPAISLSIALFGVLISLVALLIHLRSRQMLDRIEEGLEREEMEMFPREDGFLYRPDSAKNRFFMRHKYQFPFTYLMVLVGFLAMAGYAGRWEDVACDRFGMNSFGCAKPGLPAPAQTTPTQTTPAQDVPTVPQVPPVDPKLK